MAQIVLDNVDLTFHVRKHGRVTLKEFLVRHMYRQSVNPIMEVHALKNISLELEHGGRLGVLGHNGAGKSTLLRLLAGVYPPSSGTRLVEGRISSVFNISLGFEADGTGYENIFYRGYLQGETPRSMGEKVDAIADFTELGEFLHMPVRYYSSGMMVRLAFSIATACHPEVLLIDEVLGAGDLAFQQKARDRMKELISRAKLLVMVSHDLNSLVNTCEQGLWLDHGSIRMSGPIAEVVEAYKKASTPQKAAA